MTRSGLRQRCRILVFGAVAAAGVIAALACMGDEPKPVVSEASSSEPRAGPEQRKSWAGATSAPPFPRGLTWFNVERPLTLDDLRGRVVILDFWTLGCINCQHVIPDLKRLEEEFGDRLVVIGVHSGKYATEHDDDSIREAIRRFGLQHPVVNDPDFVFWRAYGANAWPTFVVIDPAGNAVGIHAGEGAYQLFQPIAASLIAEFGARNQLASRPIPLKPDTIVAATVLSFPGDVAVDEASGRLFIADSGNNRILVADLAGRLIARVGTGSEGFADGGADEATFRQPQGIGLSGDGRTLYVADTRNHAIRAIDLETLTVRTIAGTGKQLDRLPAAGAQARQTALASPWDVVEVRGDLFVTMAGVHQLWRLDVAPGAIGVFAGTSREGINDGPRRTAATLAQPSGLTTDGTNLFWVDPESSSVRLVPIAGEGEVETLVGTGLFDYGDDDGIGRRAKLQHPQGIVFAAGGLVVTDTYNHKVKSVAPANAATRTLAGSERGRKDGAAADAKFDEPGGIAFARGILYVADTNNHAVRAVDIVTGSVTTLQLTNLAVLSGGAAAARKVTLPAVETSPGAANLRLIIASPAGYHLNSLAPGRVSLASSDATVVEPGERSLQWSTDEPAVTIPIPSALAGGTATVTAVVEVYYCRTGEEALCFIHVAELALPVRVRDGATGALEFRYDLPPGGA